jgi:hypothetical protein
MQQGLLRGNGIAGGFVEAMLADDDFVDLE